MKYWKESFGIVAVIGGIVTYITGHLIFYVID
jgi:hypothetical protein